MNSIEPDENEHTPWLAVLGALVHRWELEHGGSLRGFPETKAGVHRLIDGGASAAVLRDAPDFQLESEAGFVMVSVEGAQSWRIPRYSNGAMSRKHHQVPQMLIKRWANEEGRVLWRRAQWKRGRVASMHPSKIMRRSGAYAARVGIDPRRLGMSPDVEPTEVLETYLSELEGVTARTLRQIDELVERTPAGQPAQWEGELLLAQEVLKIFVIHQMIRTEKTRQRLRREVPLDEWVRSIQSNAPRRTDVDVAAMQRSYDVWLATSTSLIHPDHPWYQAAVGPHTEIYIALPDPPADVFPLTDHPVWPIPAARQDAAGNSTDLGAWPFLPVSPRFGIGIKPTEQPRSDVKWGLIPVDAIMHVCVGIADDYSEVVLPWERTRVWDVFGAT